MILFISHSYVIDYYVLCACVIVFSIQNLMRVTPFFSLSDHGHRICCRTLSTADYSTGACATVTDSCWRQEGPQCTKVVTLDYVV